jgi:hypothetical protein
MEAKRSIGADPKCPECHKSEIMDIFLLQMRDMQTRAGQGTEFPLNACQAVIGRAFKGVLEGQLSLSSS